jgi:hypothetical protein
MTWGLFTNLPASVFQKSSNWAVVAASGSEVFPITLPVVGCCEGLLIAHFQLAISRLIPGLEVTYLYLM